MGDGMETAAAIYVRRSALDDREGDNRSLGAQERECRAWAERECLTRLDKVFTGAVDALACRSGPYEAGTSPVQRALVRSASIDLRSSDGQKVRLGTPVLWAPQRLKKCRPTGPT